MMSDWDAMWERALEEDPEALLRYAAQLVERAEELVRKGRSVRDGTISHLLSQLNSLAETKRRIR